MEGREIASSYLVVGVAEERLGPAGLVHGHVAEDLVEGVLADEHVHVHRPRAQTAPRFARLTWVDARGMAMGIPRHRQAVDRSTRLHVDGSALCTCV